jgi:putative membrane protein
MLTFIVRVLISALGLWLATKVVPGIFVDAHSLSTLLVAAILLGVANAIVRPILIVLTLPITVVTLGLFLLIINGAMLKLVAFFLHGFHVETWTAAILGAIVVGLTGWVASWFIHTDGRPEKA